MMEDMELVSRIISGDIKAFDLLVRQYQLLVFHVAGRMIDNPQDVEEVCQDTFIKIYKGMHHFGFRSKLSTWIASIAYLTSVTHLKKTKKYRFPMEIPESGPLLSSEEDPLEGLIKKDLSSRLHDLVNQLPALQKLLVTLYHLHGFSYTEMVDITGMPEGTLKSYLFRARKMLKDRILENRKIGIAENHRDKIVAENPMDKISENRKEKIPEKSKNKNHD